MLINSYINLDFYKNTLKLIYFYIKQTNLYKII